MYGIIEVVVDFEVVVFIVSKVGVLDVVRSVNFDGERIIYEEGEGLLVIVVVNGGNGFDYKVGVFGDWDVVWGGVFLYWVVGYVFE